MAKKDASSEPQPPVVVAVFEDFIKRLETDSSIGSDTIGKLRQSLVEDQQTSVDDLRSALFSEEPLP